MLCAHKRKLEPRARGAARLMVEKEIGEFKRQLEGKLHDAKVGMEGAMREFEEIFRRKLEAEMPRARQLMEQIRTKQKREIEEIVARSALQRAERDISRNETCFVNPGRERRELREQVEASTRKAVESLHDGFSASARSCTAALQRRLIRVGEEARGREGEGEASAMEQMGAQAQAESAGRTEIDAQSAQVHGSGEEKEAREGEGAGVGG